MCVASSAPTPMCVVAILLEALVAGIARHGAVLADLAAVRTKTNQNIVSVRHRALEDRPGHTLDGGRHVTGGVQLGVAATFSVRSLPLQ